MATQAKQSPTVRISEKSHSTLRELSAKYGEPMQSVLDKALEKYRREKFFEELNAAYLVIRADPEAWQAELDERRLLEGTLMDGLDPNEVWTEADFIQGNKNNG